MNGSSPGTEVPAANFGAASLASGNAEWKDVRDLLALFLRAWSDVPANSAERWRLLEGLAGVALELHRAGADVGHELRAHANHLASLGEGEGLIDLLVEYAASGELVGALLIAKLSAQHVNTDRAQAADSDDSDWDLPVPFGEYDLPPFPLASLPPRLGDFVGALALATQTPEDLGAMVALATVSAACAKKVIVRVREGWQEPINVFTVVALDPANRKTQVFRVVTAPLTEYEAEEVKRTRPAIAAAIERKKILEEKLKRLRSAAAEGDDDGGNPEQYAIDLAQEIAELAVPVAPHFIVDDSTPEHVAKALCEQAGRLAIMSPEGGVFDLMGGRYGQGGPNFEVLLKGHAGDDLRVGRVGTGVQYVAAPALTVGLAVQPEVIRGLFDVPGFRGRGLLARFLYSIPKSLLGRRDVAPPPLSAHVDAAYRADVLALLALPFANDGNGGTAPYTITLLPAAYEKLMMFASWLEPRLADGGDFGFMSDWAGKLVGAVARVAGLLHMVENAHRSAPWEVPVQTATIDSAVTVGRYLIAHARAAFAEMGADPVIAEARHILRWIEREAVSEFQKRAAYQGTKSYFKTVEKMSPGLELLIQHGYIRERMSERPSGRGRPPSPTYDVNPRSHNSHYSQNRRPAGNSEDCGDCGERDVFSSPEPGAEVIP